MRSQSASQVLLVRQAGLLGLADATGSLFKAPWEQSAACSQSLPCPSAAAASLLRRRAARRSGGIEELNRQLQARGVRLNQSGGVLKARPLLSTSLFAEDHLLACCGVPCF